MREFGECQMVQSDDRFNRNMVTLHFIDNHNRMVSIAIFRNWLHYIEISECNIQELNP